MKFDFLNIRVTRQKKNFYKNVRVTNSKCDGILRNSVLKLKNSEPHFSDYKWSLPLMEHGKDFPNLHKQGRLWNIQENIAVN